MKIELNLTQAEAATLCEVLSEYWDEGPGGEGWQSDALSRLSAKVSDAVKQSARIDSAEKHPPSGNSGD